MDELTLVIISAALNGVGMAVSLYIGMSRGTRKTAKVMLDEIEKRAEKSPTVETLKKMLATSDKLFGDDQAIEQITRFFKEAGDLVSSPEIKNILKTLKTPAPPMKPINKMEVEVKHD